ncbi:MAG TPA: hypothetical protein VLB84_02640 [Bacteroidia bacterium]|nr:hypothetical protein [Bacteroidia bacterium]
MNDQELTQLWKAQDAKLEHALMLNKQLIREVVSQKAHISLQSLGQLKTRGIVAFCIYLVILGGILVFAIANYSSAANYFIISIAAIFLINIKGLADYIKHLVWIHTIDYNGSVVVIQQKLARLQFSIIKHSRVMTLQFPFFTTFYLSNTWFPNTVPLGFLFLQFLITGAFTYLSIWLYKNQTIENLDKKWFRLLLSGSGGKKITDALAFYEEIERYKLTDRN